MNVIKDAKAFEEILKNIDEKIDRLNDQKITVFFETLGLHKRDDITRDYLNWENTLIVVPDRHISNQIKKYKYSIQEFPFLPIQMQKRFISMI